MNNPLMMPTMLTDKPIRLAFDPDTGLLQLGIVGELEFLNPISRQRETKQWEQVIGLTREASQALLAALPMLQSLLEQAVKGPTKPSSLQ